MFTLRDAFKKACEQLYELYGKEFNDPFLEEAEKDLVGDWVVTVSFSSKQYLGGIIQRGSREYYEERSFKKLRINSDTGQIKSIEIRPIAV